ncbi:MAG: DUF1285 domain-containing protein [Henriciella sp.]|nr:DUF1285 domain-containing protein [Henriciella sp.]
MAPEGVEGKLPPVHLWNPEHCGDIQMEIRRDGSWWHEGTRIGRERLVKLFSRILRKDPDGEIYLVTPYEKVIVHVEDAPFLAVRVDRVGEPGPDQVLVFKTNLDDVTMAGPDAPLRVETDPETLEPAPYVLVRGGLEAKLTRPVFYELANIAVAHEGSVGKLGVWSNGVFYELGPAA